MAQIGLHHLATRQLLAVYRFGEFVGAEIGDNCIINSRALVEHGSVVGSHCHIATGALVNGDVIIGERTFVGSGAVIREGLSVGSDCVIAMGALVHIACGDGMRLPAKGADQ
jgi:UDP-3-O-[3-hydroxymyristoyl] glucosamine N-acyltransferase